MAEIVIRWSEQEAAKPYARPFAVRFQMGGDLLGSVAVSGVDLLYFRQFQVAVLSLAGELFRDAEIERHGDPQRAWLDRLATMLPAASELRLRPVSMFDHDRGRIFHVEIEGCTRPATIPAGGAVDYQEFQAALAHQCGSLYRDPSIEAVEDPQARQVAWMDRLESLLERPGEEDLMAQHWPWRTQVPR